MKLYNFNPNDYGTQFTVMAESKEAAIAAVQAAIEKQKKAEARLEAKEVKKYGPPNPKYHPSGRYTMSHAEYMQKDLDRYVRGEGERTIDEHEAGEVIQTELC